MAEDGKTVGILNKDDGTLVHEAYVLTAGNDPNIIPEMSIDVGRAQFVIKNIITNANKKMNTDLPQVGDKYHIYGITTKIKNMEDYDLQIQKLIDSGSVTAKRVIAPDK